VVLLDIVALYRVNGVPGSVEELFGQAAAAAAAIQRPLQRAEVFTRIGREYALEGDAERAETFTGRGRQITELQDLSSLDSVASAALRSLVVTELQQQQIGYVTRLIGRVGDSATAAELYRVFGDYFLAQEQEESAGTAYSIALATVGSADTDAEIITASRILLSYISAGSSTLPEDPLGRLEADRAQSIRRAAAGPAGADIMAAVLLSGTADEVEAVLSGPEVPLQGLISGLRTIGRIAGSSAGLSAEVVAIVRETAAEADSEVRSGVSAALAAIGEADTAAELASGLPDARSISVPAAAIAAAQLASSALDREAERLLVTRLQELSPIQ
jgi:hypothetical protein